MSRGASIGGLSAVVLLAMLLAWFLGHESAPQTVSTPLQPSPEGLGEPPEISRLSASNAVKRAPAEDARDVEPGSDLRQGTLLDVLVISRSTRAPLAGIRVRARASEIEGESSIEDVASPRGGFDRAPITGADGRVELDLPSGIPIRLSTHCASGNASSVSQDVSALDVGEKRKVVLGLRTDEELPFCGVILTRAERRPIPGALVQVLYPGQAPPGPSSDATSDAEGRFQIKVSAWKAPPLRIEAPTWGTALVCPGSGHETPSTEFVVLLEHTASIRFHLIDAEGITGARVGIRVETSGRNLAQPEEVPLGMSIRLPDPSWNADADDEGRCLIENIPAGAPLTIEVSRDRRVLRKEIEPWTLRPGEIREFEWRIGATCRLTGRVVDQANAPVVNQDLWILRTESGLQEFLNPSSERRLAVRTKTDRGGSYAVTDLGPGRWSIGPAPARWNPKSSRERAIAPLAVLLEIPEGTRDIRRDLLVHRGLYIRGRVLDPSGEPLSGAVVLVSSQEITLQDRVKARDEGAFEYGPLTPARYRLSATAGEEFIDSEQVEAFAGDEGVVLRLKHAREFSGIVVDGRTGAPCSAQLTVIRLDRETPLSVMLAKTNEDGAFRIYDLVDGVFDVTAQTGDARVGFVRGVRVSGGSGPDGIELRVSPGAKVGIRYEGNEPFVRFEISTTGVLHVIGILRNGTSTTQVTPVGRVIVKFKVGDPERTQERTFDLVAGEEREVVFKDGD